MSPANNLPHRANLTGSLWMIAAMAAFALEDGFFKAAARGLPVGQALAMMGVGGAVLFAAHALWRGEALAGRAVFSRAMRIRIPFEITGRLFYALSLAYTPLSATTAILQATPIVVVSGAALVFGERVGWRRWLAIIGGLVGVLVILRPAADSFSVLSLLAVVGMLGFAGRDLASRAAPASLSTAVLGLWGYLSLLAAGLLFAAWTAQPLVAPTPATAWPVAGATASGVVAYACLMKAMRTGDVATVTPFRYTRLLFGLTLGVVAFGERLDAATIAGALVVVVSGVFILRSRKA
jgi:drug/metabolite transporter (DMT)-like permease